MTVHVTKCHACNAKCAATSRTQGPEGAEGAKGAESAKGAKSAEGAEGGEGAKGAQRAQGPEGAEGAKGAQLEAFGERMAVMEGTEVRWKPCRWWWWNGRSKHWRRHGTVGAGSDKLKVMEALETLAGAVEALEVLEPVYSMLCSMICPIAIAF